MEWLNEPASWQRTGDVLTVSVDPGTDFWRETGYGYIRDSGHVYGEVLAGDLDVSVRIRGVLTAQYDQAGVMLRADAQTWLKTGIEFFEGRARLSTVLTLGRSSWMVTDLPAGSDDILLRVSRRGDAVEVRYLAGEGQAELAALVYMPPGAQVLAGVMAAAPEGPGFRISFHDLHVTERDWSAEAGDAGDWAGEPAWAGGGGVPWPGDERPLDEAGADAWSGENGAPSSEPSSWEGQEPASAWDSGQPESDRPGWASGAASGDHPSWPSGTTPLVNEADWLASIPEEDDPDWPKKLAMEDDPGWASGSGAAELEDSDPSGASGSGAAESKGSDPGGASGTGAAEPEDSDISWAFGSGAAQPNDGDPSGVSASGAASAKDSDAGWATETGTDVSKDTDTGWTAGTGADAAKDDDPGQAEGPATGERPGGAAPATDQLTGPAGPPTGPEPPLPGQPAETGRQAWAPAPTLADPVADWDRLAAGVQPGRPVVHAERWAAQVDADVANEWPGPPLRAARLAAISGGLTPADQPRPVTGTDPGAPATKEPGVPAEPEAPAEPGAPAGPGALNGPAAQAEPGAPAEPGPPLESRAEGEPADGRDNSGQAPAGPDEPGPVKRRKSTSLRPPLDLPGPPDPADEWISLLTADPADE
jgi:uncharacterized protein